MKKTLAIVGFALLALVAGAAGPVVNSIVATTCSAQFVRAISASGAATCASIAAGDFPALTGDVTTPGGSLATTLAASARLKSKIITGTRDLTVASGSVGYTGMGFQPTACVALGGVGSSANYNTFFGMSDSALGQAQDYALGAQFNRAATFLRFNDSTGSNEQSAALASYDADGFTITWTKTGTPTGTATFYVMCLR